jgi:hypothetical protein
MPKSMAMTNSGLGVTSDIAVISAKRWMKDG